MQLQPARTPQVVARGPAGGVTTSTTSLLAVAVAHWHWAWFPSNFSHLVINPRIFSMTCCISKSLKRHAGTVDLLDWELSWASWETELGCCAVQRSAVIRPGPGAARAQSLDSLRSSSSCTSCSWHVYKLAADLSFSHLYLNTAFWLATRYVTEECLCCRYTISFEFFLSLWNIFWILTNKRQACEIWQ